MLNKDLLDIITCPLSGEPLEQQGDWLINVKWEIKYPVRQGIPIMLIDQAQLPEGVTIDQLKKKIAGD